MSTPSPKSTSSLFPILLRRHHKPTNHSSLSRLTTLFPLTELKPRLCSFLSSEACVLCHKQSLPSKAWMSHTTARSVSAYTDRLSHRVDFLQPPGTLFQRLPTHAARLFGTPCRLRTELPAAAAFGRRLAWGSRGAAQQGN